MLPFEILPIVVASADCMSQIGRAHLNLHQIKYSFQIESNMKLSNFQLLNSTTLCSWYGTHNNVPVPYGLGAALYISPKWLVLWVWDPLNHGTISTFTSTGFGDRSTLLHFINWDNTTSCRAFSAWSSIQQFEGKFSNQLDYYSIRFCPALITWWLTICFYAQHQKYINMNFLVNLCGFKLHNWSHFMPTRKSKQFFPTVKFWLIIRSQLRKVVHEKFI